MIAGFKSQVVECRDERGNPGVPSFVGEPHLAIDDGERIRIALDARQKARAEVKHGQLSSRCRPAAASAAFTIDP